MIPEAVLACGLLALAIYCLVVAIASWLQSCTDDRPHRARIYWQEYGLTDTHLDEQWLRREHAQDQRQVTLDATQRVLGRLVR